MANEVTICNQALSYLGADPITSLEDNNATAALMKVNYDTLRDAVLEERHWTFATLRRSSTTANTPPYGDGFAHAIPQEYLLVYRVFRNVVSFDPNNWVPSTGWRREGANIIAREETIHMWGTERLTNTNRYTSMFRQCLAARLAADLCMAITESAEHQERMWKLYASKIVAAAASDGGQGDVDIITQHKLTGVRGGAGVGDGYIYG